MRARDTGVNLKRVFAKSVALLLLLNLSACEPDEVGTTPKSKQAATAKTSETVAPVK